MTRFVKCHISLTRNMKQLSLRGSVATAAIPKIGVRTTIQPLRLLLRGLPRPARGLAMTRVFTVIASVATALKIRTKNRGGVEILISTPPL